MTSPHYGEYRTQGDTTLSYAAQLALGHDGMLRLEKFRSLQFDWDRRGASSIEEASVRALSTFFRDSSLEPKRLGLFMAPSGHLIVNWEDADSNLVELEFLADRVLYFFEGTGEEGEVSRNSGEIARLFVKLKDNVA